MALPLILAVVLALLVPGVARADVTIAEGPEQLAHIHLIASSSTTADVRIVEQVDGQELDVPAATVPGAADASVGWTCRESRVFVAIAGGERSVPYAVATPSCAGRLKLSTLRAVDTGDDLRVTLVDRWHQGALWGEVCAGRHDLPLRCQPYVMPEGGYAVHVLYRAGRHGRWNVRATTQYGEASRSLSVRRRHYAGGPRILFTGDSMMLATRHVLVDRLPGEVGTIDDIYVGSGITRPFVVDWSKLPARQVRTYRPDATIISLGIGDSRGVDGAPCCGEEWIAAYASRVRTIMRTYARGGEGAVVWMNLPLSSNPELWPAQAAVNVAIARATVGATRVEVVDLNALFTADGAFHRYRFVDGRRRRVRTEDGIHLTRAGARVASRQVMTRLRRLGIIG